MHHRVGPPRLPGLGTIAQPDAAAKADTKTDKKAADTKDSITENVYETKEIALKKAYAAQSAARHAVTDDTGSVKPGVPLIAALIAAAVVIGLVVWRRRR